MARAGSGVRISINCAVNRAILNLSPMGAGNGSVDDLGDGKLGLLVAKIIETEKPSS